VLFNAHREDPEFDYLGDERLSIADMPCEHRDWIARSQHRIKQDSLQINKPGYATQPNPVDLITHQTYPEL
jgi:hypothetical protein